MERRLKELPPSERAQQSPVPHDLLPPRAGGGAPGAIFDDLIGCK